MTTFLFIVSVLYFFYLNPFYLEQKFDDATDRHKVQTLLTCLFQMNFIFTFVRDETTNY